VLAARTLIEGSGVQLRHRAALLDSIRKRWARKSRSTTCKEVRQSSRSS
jgi:hypothetical protein